jgi:hypothetical protein
MEAGSGVVRLPWRQPTLDHRRAAKQLAALVSAIGHRHFLRTRISPHLLAGAADRFRSSYSRPKRDFQEDLVLILGAYHWNTKNISMYPGAAFQISRFSAQ